MRVTIRVKPGASRDKVGGRYGDDSLIVATSAPAVDGRATAGALHALAKALQIPARDITLVTGHTSRTKIVEVPDTCACQVEQLLG
ncbi:MAG: DUF167 domain-containing protein [Propionibacteriaceae bacterium]